MLLVSAVSCKKNLGKPMMTLGDTVITENMFMLYLSRAKGSAVYASSDAKNDKFWDILVTEDGGTYDDMYKDLVLESAKNTLAAVYLFDEVLGLTLTKEEYAAIDEELEKLMRNASDGGTKNELNAVLSGYGANYDILREAYIMEAKLEKVQIELFGKDASMVSDILKQEYMEKNYVRFKHVFIYTVNLEYEKDADGNVAYFNKSTHQYLYIKDGTTSPKKNENGENLRDKFGNIIYYHDDGTVAYDKENGSPATKYDSNGNTIVSKMSEEELAEHRAYAERILNLANGNESFEHFDTLVATYSEDDGSAEYPNGIYLSETSNYDAANIRDEVFKMEIGETKMVSSEYGIHIIKRYELDDGAFANSTNSGFFTDFNQSVSDYLFVKRLAEYMDDIVIDTKIFEAMSMKKVEHNYYY